MKKRVCKFCNGDIKKGKSGLFYWCEQDHMWLTKNSETILVAAQPLRAADDDERRARDEQSRLQSDLEDAEAKLKTVQRGW